LWTEIQRANPALDSPYCHPGFTAAMAELRNNVYVGLLREGGEVVGFFPFEKVLRRTGRPVGGRVSDFQAVITRPEIRWSARDLIAGCGLSVWDFDRLSGTQQEFAEFCCQSYQVAQVDLCNGFEHYAAEKHRDGSGIVRQTERKRRKLAREMGDVELLADVVDTRMLRQLMAWKSRQYRRTDVTDVFAVSWTRDLLERLLMTGHNELRGVLSVLLVGGRPAAFHFGLRSRSVLHCWFPVYDEQLSVYSPGAILFMAMIRSCPEMGVQRLDLGGVSHWKARLMNRTATICEGSVDLRPVASKLRNVARASHQWLRNSPLRKPARVPWRAVYHFKEWLAYRWMT